MTAKDHNKLIGILLLIHGGFQTLLMLFIMLLYGGLGASFIFGAKGEGKMVGVALFIAIVVIAVFAVVLFLPQLLGGWKIFKEKPNAKLWGIIGCVLALFSIPFGTALGIYGLWFLAGDEGRQFYDGGRSMVMPPPPPNSWQ